MDMTLKALRPEFTPDAGPITLEGDRARRFYQSLCEALDANDALATSAKSFSPPIASGPGVINGSLAVEAYSKLLRDRLNLMLLIIEGEEASIDIPMQQGASL